MDVGCSLKLFVDSTTTPQHHLLSITPKLPKIQPHLHRHTSVRVDPYAHPQHIKILKHFVYIQYGCGMHSIGGLSLSHEITSSLRLRLPQYCQKSTPDLHRHYSVRVDPYAHPQHIKVLKHFVYVWHGCGMYSKWVWSFNCDLITSLGLNKILIFLKSYPTWHKSNRVRVIHMPIHSISRC